MANRDVSIAICGAVVGVILGAGSLAFSQDVSLQGSAAVGNPEFIARTLTPRQLEQTRARNINRRRENGELNIVDDQDKSKAPTVKVDPADVKAVVEEKQLTVCRAVREILDRVAEAHKKFIPGGTEKNTELRNNLEKTLKDLRANGRYCTSADEEVLSSSSSSSSSSVPTIDNDCDKYRGIRFTICRLYERKGQVYN